MGQVLTINLLYIRRDRRPRLSILKILHCVQNDGRGCFDHHPSLPLANPPSPERRLCRYRLLAMEFLLIFFSKVVVACFKRPVNTLVFVSINCSICRWRKTIIFNKSVIKRIVRIITTQKSNSFHIVSWIV